MNNPDNLPVNHRTFDFKPYLGRQRTRRKKFSDWQRYLSNPKTSFRNFRSKHRQIHHDLAKKGVTGRSARLAARRILNASAQFRFDTVIAAQAVNARMRSLAARKTLIRELTRLERFLSALPPHSIAACNAKFRKLDQSAFDSEMFDSVITSVADVLREVGPPQKAKKACNVIYKPRSRQMADREPRSALIEMWEALPPITRQAVEADVRAARPSRSITIFFKRLDALLRRHAPKAAKAGPMDGYLRQLSKVTTPLGIPPAYAHYYSGPYSKNSGELIRSTFQRLGASALQAVGDASPVSKRAVKKCQRGTVKPRKLRKTIGK